jgi:hypothetical protein
MAGVNAARPQRQKRLPRCVRVTLTVSLILVIVVSALAIASHFFLDRQIRHEYAAIRAEQLPVTWNEFVPWYQLALQDNGADGYLQVCADLAART